MQRRSPRGRPMIPFGITCVCVLGSWPQILFVSLASSLVSSTSPLVSCFYRCYNCWCQSISWSWLWVGKPGKVLHFLLLCFAFFTLLFFSIGLFDEGLGRIGGLRLAGLAPEYCEWDRGAEKTFAGSHVSFSLKIGSEDQKMVFIPNYAPGYGSFASFRGTILTSGTRS